MDALVDATGAVTFAFSARNITRLATFIITDNEISMKRNGTLIIITDPGHGGYLTKHQIEELPGVIIPKLRKQSTTSPPYYFLI
jgi:hypothetical protein